MTHCQSDPDSNAASQWHFRQYAAAAERLAGGTPLGGPKIERPKDAPTLAASEAEDDSRELIRFAKYRFDCLLTLFTANFHDSSAAIPGFLAGCSASHARRRATPVKCPRIPSPPGHARRQAPGAEEHKP
jgi:hypothetical protein